MTTLSEVKLFIETASFEDLREISNTLSVCWKRETAILSKYFVIGQKVSFSPRSGSGELVGTVRRRGKRNVTVEVRETTSLGREKITNWRVSPVLLYKVKDNQ